MKRVAVVGCRVSTPNKRLGRVQEETVFGTKRAEEVEGATEIVAASDDGAVVKEEAEKAELRAVFVDA